MVLGKFFLWCFVFFFCGLFGLGLRPFFVMAGRVARPNTLVIQCPEQIAALSQGEFKSIPKPVVRACQFLPKNYVRVTFKDKASHDQALVKGVSVRGFQLNDFEADPKAALVYCYWVPVEVSTDSIRHALSAYGQVLECQRHVHPEFQDIESGFRIVRVKLTTQIIEVIRILNFPCNIYYRGQPKSCRSCKRTGHLAKDCPFKDKCFRCGSANHQARDCTNAWNVNPPAPAAPGPHPSATSEPPAAASSSGTHPPSAGSHSPPPSSAPPGSHLAPGASQGPASGVPPASSQVSSQDPLVAGLPLVPDSPLPVFSGMPPLEELPSGPTATSPAGALDQHGFLASLPSHPGVSAPNPPLLPSGSTPSSTVILSNNSVGGQCSPSSSNVGCSMGSTLTNVASQKSSSYNGSYNSNSNVFNSSSLLGCGGPVLSYSGPVGQIPNSNSSNSHHPIPIFTLLVTLVLVPKILLMILSKILFVQILIQLLAQFLLFKLLVVNALLVQSPNCWFQLCRSCGSGKCLRPLRTPQWTIVIFLWRRFELLRSFFPPLMSKGLVLVLFLVSKVRR